MPVRGKVERNDLVTAARALCKGAEEAGDDLSECRASALSSRKNHYDHAPVPWRRRRRPVMWEVVGQVRGLLWNEQSCPVAEIRLLQRFRNGAR